MICIGDNNNDNIVSSGLVHVSRYYHIGGTDKQMRTEHWWNDTDMGKPIFSEINPSQGHSDHSKTHMDWNGTAPGAPQ
jgi:hypothetical protein